MSVHAPRGVALQFNARQQAVQQERIRQGAVSGQPSEVHDHTDNANGINSSQFNYPQANQNVQQEDKNIFQQFGDWCKDVWEKSNPFFKALEVIALVVVTAFAVKGLSWGGGKVLGFARDKSKAMSAPFGNPKLADSRDAVQASIENCKKALENREKVHSDIAMYQHQFDSANADIQRIEETRGSRRFGRVLNPIQNQFDRRVLDARERKVRAQEGLEKTRKRLGDTDLHLSRVTLQQHDERRAHSIALARENLRVKESELAAWKEREAACRKVHAEETNPKRKEGLAERLKEIQLLRETAESVHANSVTFFDRLQYATPVSTESLISSLDRTTGNITSPEAHPHENDIQDFLNETGDRNLLEHLESFLPYQFNTPNKTSSQEWYENHLSQRAKQGWQESAWGKFVDFFTGGNSEYWLRPLVKKAPKAS
jgi:hypothetical protein